MQDVGSHRKALQSVPPEAPSSSSTCSTALRRCRSAPASARIRRLATHSLAAALTISQEREWVFSIRLRAQELWFNVFDGPPSPDTLFCPTEQPLALGARVRVKILAAGGPRLTLTGVVVSCNRPSQGCPRPGVDVRVHPSSRPTLAFIHAWARHELEERRGAARLPLRLLVSYTIDGQQRLNFTEDLSAGGLFLNTISRFKQGRPVRLRVTDPRASQPILLQGAVAHGSTTQGIGIRLVDPLSEQRRRYFSFLARLEQMVHSGELNHSRDGGSPGTSPRG